MTKTLNPATRKTVTLAESMWGEIHNYAEQEGIATDSEAMRRLLQYSLKRLLRTPDRHQQERGKSK